MKRSEIKRNPETTKAFHDRAQAKQRQKPREGQSKPLKRNSHLKPVSEKGRIKKKAYKAARAPYMAAHPICEMCEFRPATECHHKKRRIGNLLTDTDYFAALCHDCHHHIHFVDPESAYANGWLIGQDAATDTDDLEAD